MRPIPTPNETARKAEEPAHGLRRVQHKTLSTLNSDRPRAMRKRQVGHPEEVSHVAVQ